MKNGYEGGREREGGVKRECGVDEPKEEEEATEHVHESDFRVVL